MYLPPSNPHPAGQSRRDSSGIAPRSAFAFANMGVSSVATVARRWRILTIVMCEQRATKDLLWFVDGGGKVFLYTGLKKPTLLYLVGPHEFTTSLVENHLQLYFRKSGRIIVVSLSAKIPRQYLFAIFPWKDVGPPRRLRLLLYPPPLPRWVSRG